METSFLILRMAIEVHDALDGLGIRHAIGGAICLGYHVEDPRATDDIDINITAPATRAPEILAALPDGVRWTGRSVEDAIADDQVRVLWDVPGSDIPVPLDLFFAAHRYHQAVASRTRTVPMLDRMVPILAATDLLVFKVLFNRPKDWVDIEEMLAAKPESLDLADARMWLAEILGEGSPGGRKLDRVAGRVRRARPAPVAAEIFGNRTA
jgi:hypothetical protein